MKFSNQFLILVCLILLCRANVFAQSLDSLTADFDQYHVKNFHEKLYAHLDRDFYITGETIWIKIYSVDATLHTPLQISRVAYVEILDDQNNVALSGKISLNNGVGTGSFFIPATLSSGNYMFRAYTSWMKNASADFYFHKTISIVNTFISAASLSVNSTSDRAVIESFPEGGNLVKGIRSKIAFKVTDLNSSGIDCRVVLLNSKGDTVVNTRPSKFGIGYFYFTPGDEGAYKLIAINKQKVIGSSALPAIHAGGYVLALQDSSSVLQINVSSTLHDSRPVHLIAHGKRKIFFTETMQSGAILKAQIRKSDIPDGINHITLFDADLKAVCERLYFKYPGPPLAINVTTDNDHYNTRKAVNVELTVPRDSKKSSPSLSVSVFKLDSLSQPDKAGIFEYLWLSSELVGEIESPEFYFSNDSLAQQSMDNLMLTHGWRRFKWSNLHETKPTLHVPEYRTHIIRALIKDRDGKPVNGASAYLSTPDKVIRLYPSISDKNGVVKFEVTHAWNKRQLILQTKDSTLSIEMLNPFSEDLSTRQVSPLHLTNTMANALTERSIGMQVQDIFDPLSRSRFVKPVVDSIAFYGSPDETYKLDDFTRFPVMEEVLREYVPGVLVRKNRDGFYFILLDRVNSGVLRESPMVLLDGVPIFDPDKIMAYDPRKIEKLEVETRPYYLGSQLFNGIISFSTYRGDLSGFEVNGNSTIIDYEGLQLQREFYEPKYQTIKDWSDRTPDFRNLLYWAPEITTDSSGSAKLTFYTSDLEGKYMIRVEGMSSAGGAGSASATFEVKALDN